MLIESIGKPVVLAEIGRKTIKDGSFDNLEYLKLSDLEGITCFVAWNAFGDNKSALIDNRNYIDILAHPNIMNLLEIDY